VWHALLLTVAVLAPGQDSSPAGDRQPPVEDQSAENTPKAKPAAPQETPAELRRRVNRLVRQLDADALADRQAAEKELTAVGPPVLELLPATNSRTPAEVRQRLARIVNIIESEAAERSAEPSLVTLDGTMPLADAITALQQQTGNRIAGYEDASADVETGFQDRMFWQALDSLLDQARLNVNAYGGTPGVMELTARPEEEVDRSARATYAGVFRFEPLRVQSVRNLRNPSIEGVRVAVRVEWEPRVQPVSLSQPLSDVSATDDLGNALSTSGQGERGSEVRPGVSGVEIELPFELPQRKATKITSLKGKLTALVPGRVETFEFARRLDLARGMELRKAGATVILDRVRKTGELYQIRIRVRFDEAGGALQSHRGWMLQNEAYVIDGQGQRVDHLGLERTRQDVNEVGVAYQFQLSEGLEGCRFVYKSPAMILELPVEYELKDIPLP
jgi:hypothetical protein